ncbi:MAG: transcriptional regulator [Planctomycetes bacterium]|jgi:predicted transcriptional regulator|nr:transcriptional regulator [Planctomycetota bacterium]
MKDVTHAELAVLEALWDHAPQAVRELSERLYDTGGTAEQATVQKLLDRLRDKGFVARERDGRAYRFRPTLARDALIERRLQAVADQLCGGSLSPLITHLVRGRRLKPADVKELQGLLEDLDRRRRRKGR